MGGSPELQRESGGGGWALQQRLDRWHWQGCWALQGWERRAPAGSGRWLKWVGIVQ